MSLSSSTPRVLRWALAVVALALFLQQLVVILSSSSTTGGAATTGDWRGSKRDVDVDALLRQLMPSPSISNDNNSQHARTKLPDKLNVVLLYPEDWRHDDLGDTVPVLQTLFFSWVAQQGMRFTQNAVTTSICWISRATLFTGQFVSRHGSTVLFRPNFVTKHWPNTWPYMLQQQAGYWVGHVGKWQFKDVKRQRDKLFNYSYFFEGVMWINDKYHIATKARDVALTFLKERPKDKPFALTVTFYPPKGMAEPKDADPRFRKPYENATIPEPYDRAAAYQLLPDFLRKNETEARSRYLYRFEKVLDYQTTMRTYYASISHIDEMCRDIVNELKAQHILNQTLVIVTPDNGEFHSAHALADKWYPFQESIRVPLLILDPRMPMHKRGTLEDRYTLNIDLAETILGAAGLEPKPTMQGRDLAELYLGEGYSNNNNKACKPVLPQDPTNPHNNQSTPPTTPTRPWRTEFYYEFPSINGRIPQSQALVRKDFKYLFWPDHQYEQLFDLQHDPYEFHDLLRLLREQQNATDDNQNNVHDHNNAWRIPPPPYLAEQIRTNASAILAIKEEMKQRMIQKRFDVMHPNVPGTSCDPLLPPGTNYKALPSCSVDFPERCCPSPSNKTTTQIVAATKH